MTKMGNDRGEDSAVRGLRRRLWAERFIFLIALGAVLALHFGRPGGRRACLIAIDGRPVAVVASRSQAQRLLEEIKRSSGLPGVVSFSRKVTLYSVSATGHRVISDAEAMGILASRVQPVARAAAIIANGELVVGLPDQEEAVQALSSLLKELSPPGMDTQAAFKEKVKIEARDVSSDHFASSASAAVQRIMQAAAPKGAHEVKPGETAWKIALDYDVPISRLGSVNPGMDLDRIRAGDRLRIPGELPPITVIARREVREEAGLGESKTVRITYENGVEVSRDVIARQRQRETSTFRSRRHRESGEMGL